MELKRNMSVSAEKVFETITRSVIYDIEKETGKKVAPEDLSQFEYVKSFGKTGSATIRIEKFEKGKAYHYRTRTTKNNFLAKYDIVSLSPDTCQLTYTEEMESYGHMQKLNDALVGTILNGFKKKRFIQMLNNIEESS